MTNSIIYKPRASLMKRYGAQLKDVLQVGCDNALKLDLHSILIQNFAVLGRFIKYKGIYQLDTDYFLCEEGLDTLSRVDKMIANGEVEIVGAFDLSPQYRDNLIAQFRDFSKAREEQKKAYDEFDKKMRNYHQAKDIIIEKGGDVLNSLLTKF